MEDMQQEKKHSSDIERIAEILKKTVIIFEEDRETAKKNYQDMQAQLEAVIAESEFAYSDDAKLETTVNKALELQFKSSDKLLTVVDAFLKILTTNMNNENRLLVAEKLVVGPDGEKLIGSSVNIQQIQKRIRAIN